MFIRETADRIIFRTADEAASDHFPDSRIILNLEPFVGLGLAIIILNTKNTSKANIAIVL